MLTFFAELYQAVDLTNLKCFKLKFDHFQALWVSWSWRLVPRLPTNFSEPIIIIIEMLGWKFYEKKMDCCQQDRSCRLNSHSRGQISRAKMAGCMVRFTFTLGVYSIPFAFLSLHFKIHSTRNIKTRFLCIWQAGERLQNWVQALLTSFLNWRSLFYCLKSTNPWKMIEIRNHLMHWFLP